MIANSVFPPGTGSAIADLVRIWTKLLRWSAFNFKGLIFPTIMLVTLIALLKVKERQLGNDAPESNFRNIYYVEALSKAGQFRVQKRENSGTLGIRKQSNAITACDCG